MSKMAEEAYLQDKYGQQDYVDYLEDKIGVMIENEIKIKKQIGAKKYEEIGQKVREILWVSLVLGFFGFILYRNLSIFVKKVDFLIF